MFVAVNRGLGAAPGRRPARVIVMPRRRGVGDTTPPPGFYVGLATGICRAGQDTGDGSPCTPAVPGAQGGMSTQELAAWNASLNPGVAPITVADLVRAGQLDQQRINELMPSASSPAPASVSTQQLPAPPQKFAPAPSPNLPPPAAQGGGGALDLSLPVAIGGASVPLWMIGAGVLAAVVLLPMVFGGRK